jgi:hypothetical protein
MQAGVFYAPSPPTPASPLRCTHAGFPDFVGAWDLRKENNFTLKVEKM